MRKVLLLLFFFNIFLNLQAQVYDTCTVEFKYSINNNYSVDSSELDLYITIPRVINSVDYRLNISEIIEFDLVALYCAKDECTIPNVVKKIQDKKGSKIIIEFSNGEFDFLPVFLLHSVELVEYYEILHHDKGASYLQTKIESFPMFSFKWGGDKFRLIFLLLKTENCKTSPVSFRTGWLNLAELIN